MTTVSEELWQFPCDFPIKIVGKATPEFEAFVIGTVHRYFPDLKENALEQRSSKDGNYVAITVTVQATSKEQLDSLYQELSANPLVSMVL